MESRAETTWTTVIMVAFAFLFLVLVFRVSVGCVSDISGPGFGDFTVFFWNGGDDFGLIRWGTSRDSSPSPVLGKYLFVSSLSSLRFLQPQTAKQRELRNETSPRSSLFSGT